MSATRRSADTDAMSTGLLDADGHLLEDLEAIIERLPSPYREKKNAEFSFMGQRNLFPPIGFLNATPFEQTAVLDRKPQETGRDPESWLYFLDAVGIEQTVLYPTFGQTIHRSRDFDYAIAVCRAYNDWVADTYLRHPSGRFQAVALIPMQQPLSAVEELKRAVNELGFVGSVTQAHGMPNQLGSEFYYPVYEACQDLDVGIAFHGAGFDGLGFDDFNVYAGAHALGHPIAQLIALAGMLLNNVFEDFPGLRAAYLEAGAAWIMMAGERFTESYNSFVQSLRGFCSCRRACRSSTTCGSSWRRVGSSSGAKAVSIIWPTPSNTWTASLSCTRRIFPMRSAWTPANTSSRSWRGSRSMTTRSNF